jgi:hypothetical protein
VQSLWFVSGFWLMLFASTIAYDTLVRGGVECTSVAVYTQEELGISSVLQRGGYPITCSRGVKILADETLDAITVCASTYV